METYYWESSEPGPEGMGEFKALSDAEAIAKARTIKDLVILYKEPETSNAAMVILWEKH